jgi:hypothetical protein
MKMKYVRFFYAEILFKNDIDKTIFSSGSRLNNYIFFLLCQSRKKLKHFHIVNGGKRELKKMEFLSAERPKGK